jgi:hypothetical protein
MGCTPVFACRGKTDSAVSKSKVISLSALGVLQSQEDTSFGTILLKPTPTGLSINQNLNPVIEVIPRHVALFGRVKKGSPEEDYDREETQDKRFDDFAHGKSSELWMLPCFLVLAHPTSWNKMFALAAGCRNPTVFSVRVLIFSTLTCYLKGAPISV